MHKRTFSCGICVLAIVLITSATDLWAQDGQPKTADNAPPDYSALPPAPDDSNTDLAKRVADLEKELAKLTKAAADSKSQTPANP